MERDGNIKFIYLEESPYNPGKYTIRIQIDSGYFTGMVGSFNVFFARLMNLSYTDYLRYCRDRLGAQLVGKNTRYIVPYFLKTKSVEMFVELLNNRMRYIINEKEFPYEYIKKGEWDLERVPFNNEINK